MRFKKYVFHCKSISIIFEQFTGFSKNLLLDKEFSDRFGMLDKVVDYIMTNFHSPRLNVE